MKSKFFVACTVAMALVALIALTGCSNSKPEDSQTSTKPDSDISTGGSSSDVVTVSPLPTSIHLDHLDDCTVAVSFNEGDAFVDDTGAMQLKVKVYTYDLYDMVDISALKVGDQITICQQEVKVTSLERNEKGAVIINGGLENGGYELISNDETVFYANGFDDMKQYYELGEVTIPVSADFEFEDSANLEKGPCTYYPGDFLTDSAEIEYHFVPNNTTITIQDGYVVGMQRIYNP